LGLLDTDNMLVASFATLSGMPVFQPSRHPLADRVAAAAGAGFGGIGMEVGDYESMRRGGLSPQNINEILALHGVVVREVEGIGDWLAVGGDAEAEARRTAERLFEIAHAVGAPVTPVAVFVGPDEMPSSDVIAERFGDLCDRAAEYGLTVALEPVALGALQTVAQAAEVVTAAARPNGGVCVDSYHCFRVGERVSDAFATVAAENIVSVHFADARAEPDGALWDDCLSHRRIPGEGEFPLVELLVALDRLGVDAPIAVEIFSDELWPRPIDEALKLVAGGTRAVIASARAATT
jgi:sugar phosphate isomerase/epimerase